MVLAVDAGQAGGPSKIVGLATITDKHGHDVPKPATVASTIRGTLRQTTVSFGRRQFRPPGTHLIHHPIVTG